MIRDLTIREDSKQVLWCHASNTGETGSRGRHIGHKGPIHYQISFLGIHFFIAIVTNRSWPILLGALTYKMSLTYGDTRNESIMVRPPLARSTCHRRTVGKHGRPPRSFHPRHCNCKPTMELFIIHRARSRLRRIPFPLSGSSYFTAFPGIPS